MPWGLRISPTHWSASFPLVIITVCTVWKGAPRSSPWALAKVYALTNHCGAVHVAQGIWMTCVAGASQHGGNTGRHMLLCCCFYYKYLLLVYVSWFVVVNGNARNYLQYVYIYPIYCLKRVIWGLNTVIMCKTLDKALWKGHIKRKEKVDLLETPAKKPNGWKRILHGRCIYIYLHLPPELLSIAKFYLTRNHENCSCYESHFL